VTHPFERAGLGVAPFRCVGVEYRVGPIKYIDPKFPGVTCEVGAPGQPMGTCAYCSQGIAECCIIRDANGKEFIVGNVCVGKAAKESNDSPLERDRRKMVLAAKHDRERTASDELNWRLANDSDLRTALNGMPHPMGFKDRKTGIPLTLLDWALWMMSNSGAAGRTRVRKALGKVVSF
jgi:hypothetical protein